MKFRFLALFAVLLAVFSGCRDTGDLGMDLLPSTDLINVKNLVEKDNFSAFTFSEDSIRTDEPARSMLGSFHDPVFGLTTINFATQFRLFDMPDYGTNPVVDSVKLFLYYSSVYGDTVTPQTFRVYELESPLDVDQVYRQSINLKDYASDIQIGEIIHTPVIRLDSASQDTFFQLITIPLDLSLGQKLVNAPESVMVTNDAFMEYFKGLMIEAEPRGTTGGSLLTLEAAYSATWFGSRLAVFYNNDENKAEEKPDTLLNSFVISPFSARVSSIEHDYSGTAFYEGLNQQATADSLLYVQPTGGLKALINIDQLSSWRDSANIAINRAELIFQIDTLASEVEKYPPPSQLLFTYINKDGVEDLPADYWFSPAYYGGVLDTTDYTYRFNITQHMQLIIDERVPNNGFFLTTARKNSEANRVVIKGSESNTGIRMLITYSKYLQ